MIRAWFVIVIALVLVPGVAAAQAPAGRFEAGGGVRWTGAIQFEPVAANEKTLGGGTRAVFSTESRLQSAIGWDVRVGARLVNWLFVEGSATVSQRDLVTTISGDAEAAGTFDATESVTEYLFEAGVRARLPFGSRSRLETYVTGGGGYLRHLNDGNTLAETGRSYYGGAAWLYRWRDTPAKGVKALGWRADVRAAFLQDGVAFDDGVHASPAFGAGVFMRF